MFKLFVLAAFVAIAAARPSYLGGSAIGHSLPYATYVEEPSYASVGSIVKTIPTAVSHQSISQVHSGGHYAQPIVAPVYKTYASPAIHGYAAPYGHSIASPYSHSYGSAPLLSSAYGSYGATPYASAYGSHYGGGYYGNGAW